MATQQQDPSKNPYALQIEPFSPALQPQAYESTAPPTVSGSGGKVEGGAMIADRFLEGFSRGRKMAFDRQEQERSRLNQDINEAYGRVDRSDLPDYSDDPNAITKATLHGRLDALKYADMYQEVHKSKDKDNPAIKTLKGVFEGLVGPPKKDFKFGPEQVHQTLSGIWGDMDKAQTGKQLAEKEAQGLSQYMAGVEGQQGTTPQPAQTQPQATPQEQKPNILPYGPGAQQQPQTAAPPGGPPPQGAPQPQQAAPQSAPAPQAQTQQPPVQQQMPTAMRQQPPGQPAPVQSAPAPNQPQPGPQNKDPLADPEFMRRYQRLAALDPKNPLVGMISKRIEERDKNKASKSLAEDIKGIYGEDILEGNPEAKTAFGGPVKKGRSYVQGKDDKLYPVDPKAASAAKSHNLRSVWVFVKGKDEPIEAYSDPQDPKAPLRRVIGGEDIDSDDVLKTEPIGVLTADERGKYYGSFGDYYRAARGRGLSNSQAEADAADKLYKEKSIRLSRTQQEEAMDQALSGIGAPDTFRGQTGRVAPPAPVNATPPGGVTPKPQTGATPPQAQPQVTATAAATPPATPPARSATPPAARTATPKPTAQPTPVQNAATAQENRNIDIYLADLMGNSKFSGKGASIAKMNGMEALAKRAGVSPAEFQTAAAVDKDKVKALGDTVLRYGAIQRLNSIMDRFGPNLEKLAKEIPQTGSPLLNKAWRDIKLNAVDDPKIREYLIALNDFDRQYGTITAGGGLSKAMLPVSTQESVTKLLNPNATLGGVLGMISQIKTQARLEQEGMQDSLTKMRDEIHGSVLGAASRNQNQTTPPPAAPTAIDAAKKKYNIQY